ncbi:MAG: rod-binding protein [Novosphingobium sp.]|nr:rod-binding protein [Novosphingobium sp.]
MTPVSSLAAIRSQAPSEHEKLADAARRFEAIFVRQMLAAARKTSFDEEGLFSGEAMNAFRQMQDERFADIAAERGSFGLGRMIEAHLARLVPNEGQN